MPANYNIDLLRSLEVFIGVAETGSTTEAARLLHVTQSAISQHIRLLEKELDARLIDRRHRPLRLTPAGVALRQRGARLLSQASEAVSEVRQFSVRPLANLRIAMFGTLAPSVVPAIVAAVAEATFGIESLLITRGMATDHVRHFMNRNADIIVTSNALYNLSEMERHELIEERFVLALPKTKVPLNLGLQEIAAQLPMIRYASDTESGQMIERHLRRLKLNIRSRFSFSAADDLMRTVAAGHGWAICTPTQVVHALDERASVEFRALPKQQLSRTITLVARAGELGSAPAQVASLCRQALARELVPRIRQLMPNLTDCLTVVEKARSTEHRY